jgi:hypothetical protein
MTNKQMPFDLAAFEALLDAYGGERSRWPEARRIEAEVLLSRSAEAHRLFAEARALDALLDRATGPSAGRQAALADRIAAAALQGRGGSAGSSAVVIPLPARRAPAGPPAVAARPVLTPARTAGMLAASLVFGLMIGGLGLAPGSVEGIVQAAVFENDVVRTVAALDTDGLADVLDEDL